MWGNRLLAAGYHFLEPALLQSLASGSQPTGFWWDPTLLGSVCVSDALFRRVWKSGLQQVPEKVVGDGSSEPTCAHECQSVMELSMGSTHLLSSSPV